MIIRNSTDQISNSKSPGLTSDLVGGSVRAVGKVSPNWSQETMTCHSSNCFSIVRGQGNAPLETSLPSSCYMTG